MNKTRELVIAKGWVQAAVLVFVFGFTVLGWLAYRTYMEEPPIPQRVVDPAGNVVFTGADVMAALFLLQSLLGGSVQHYRAELSNFFGIDLARWLPYNVARTWHLQLTIFWVATSYLAAGIFIAPMIAGREPRGQQWLAYALLSALVVVVVGSLVSEYAGIYGWIRGHWEWFGNQGWEYLDLGRFWQVLLSLGLVFWVVMMFRVLRERLRTEYRGNMPWMCFYGALAMPGIYAVVLLSSVTWHY